MKECSYGIIPFHKDGDTPLVLVVYQHGSAGDFLWTFPKGKHEEGEKPLETACRELKEETGLTAEVREDIEPLSIEYSFERDGVHVDKITTYYLGFVQGTELSLQEKEIKDAKWLQPNEARKQLTFDGHKKLLDEALQNLDKRR